MKRNHLLIFELMIIAFSVFSVTAAQTESKTVVTFWYTENSSEAPGVLRLIEEFEATHPDIDIDAQAKGFFSAKETYLTQYTVELEPTVFRAARDWVVEFAFQGLIQPVTDFMNETDKQDFISDALRLVTYPDSNGEEQIWGFPQLVDVPALFYNKRLVEEAGIDTASWTTNTSFTWEEFESNIKAVWDANLDDGQGGRVYGFTLQGMFFGGQPIYYGHGARFFKNDIISVENININSTESREALTFLKKIVDAPYTPPWDQQGWETINTMFTTGQVAFIQQGPWELANFLNNAPEFNSTVDNRPYAGPDNLGIMRLPHDENGNEGAPLGGHAYVISSRATGKVREAAMEFAKFMSSTHAMVEGAIDYYHVPARESAYQDETLRNSNSWKYIEAIKRIIDRSYKNPVDHRWAQIETIFGTELDNYLAGEETLDEFIAFVTSFWSEILVEGVENNVASPTSIQTGPIPTIFILLGLFVTGVVWKRRKS
ncbi:MAG: extracellular solute-binding protein [Methanobacteriota archaeon]|nr:MAG: extracellular solute-binding protein [Euryarchaeota archaeon]